MPIIPIAISIEGPVHGGLTNAPRHPPEATSAAYPHLQPFHPLPPGTSPIRPLVGVASRSSSMVATDINPAAAQDRVSPAAADIVPATGSQPPAGSEHADPSSAELEEVCAPRPRRTVWAVPALTAAMLALTITLFLLAVPAKGPSGAPWTLEWWMLGLGFLLAESMVIHLPVQRDSHTISMSEVPLVLGLAMANPVALVLGRLSAAAAVLVMRRQPLIKLIFNLALFVLETVLALTVYRAVLGNAEPASPTGWLAAVIAIGVAVTASAGLVDVAIACSDRRRRFAEIARSFAGGSVISISVGILGTLAVVVLVAEPRAGSLLAGVLILLFVLFRTYGALSSRHDDLTSLYDFTNQVDGTLGDRDIAVVTLREAVSILRAVHGEIILSDPTDSHASYLGFVAGRKTAQRRLPVSEAADLFAISLGDRQHRIFGPRTRDSRLRIALGFDATCGMIAPISHGDGNIGLIVVAGRSGVMKHFTMAELDLLDTIANHASLTLERATVIARLRSEIHANQALIRSKDQLIAAVSHELRTPLTGVLGFAEMLRDSGSDFSTAETDTMLAAIADEAVDLTNLVEDLLTAARAQMGSLTILPTTVALRPLIGRVVESTAGPAHHIVVSGTPISALADESRVRQILRNLITNAERYGGHQIHIATYTNAETAHLRVSDNGDGIPESDQERIFAPYESAHDAGTQPGSLGLGLTISRSLAQLMSGDLTYSRSDGWTTFDLQLPMDPSHSPSAPIEAIEFEQI